MSNTTRELHMYEDSEANQYKSFSIKNDLCRTFFHCENLQAMKQFSYNIVIII